MNDTTKEFIQQHRIRLLDDTKRAHKHTRMNAQYFQFSDDYNKFYESQITFETERLLTIEIAESEFERIAEFEEQVFGNMKTQGHYNLFDTLMGQKEEEYKLQQKYPQ